MVLITHDLGVVAELCQDVVVMYAGKIIEKGTVEDIFYRPKHPYTRGLLDSIPHFETGHKLTALNTIPGSVPSLSKLPPGCRFADRCKYIKPDCRLKNPELQGTDHQAACFYPLAKEAK